MNTILKLEEAFMFAACIVLFPQLDLSWWWFAGCILLPDISMIGYLINNTYGAYSYNFFHHKGVALVVVAAGLLWPDVWLQFAGLILFAHTSLDRMLGYGLKYEQGFHFTHLGMVGKINQ